jgi:hypothetical protein
MESGVMRTHGELVAAGLRDPEDLTGLIPDSYVCIDCGMDTWPGHKTRAEVEQSMRADRAAELVRAYVAAMTTGAV